jgi:molybdenum cofactor synthesis domain-containing protein
VTPVATGSRLLSLEEALARILDGVEPLPIERVSVAEALGRVLAEPVDAAVTLPPWDNSAMDGFAVRSADVGGASASSPVRLQVIGEVAAGHAPTMRVEPGTAVRVLTGGMVPDGADTVVPVEDTDAQQGVAALPGSVAIRRAAAEGQDVRRAGSDLRAGDRLLEAGTALTPQALAVAAAGGNGTLTVHRRPRVAVLATGDELVPAGQPLGPAQIPDSNSISVASQGLDAGAEVIRLGIAPDDEAAMDEILARGIADADVVVATGGVSVGAHDLVKDAFERAGEMQLWRVAIQPGKPLAFAVAKRADGSVVRLFGLPGNPVSSFVTFELFVRPMLRALAGHRDRSGREIVRARLADGAPSTPGRRSFVRVTLRREDSGTGWVAALAGGQGSHVLSALARADGLAVVPEDDDSLPAGEYVDVMRLGVR